jgi:PhnB protein
MKTISPWINFNGNAEEAFGFYRSVFGGEFSVLTRFKDVSGAESSVPASDANKLMRIVLPIGDSGILIGNDVPEFMGRVNERENRSKIHLAADSKEEARKIFDGLSPGGEIEVPLAGDDEESSFAMFRDRYGIEWIIEFDPNT